MKTFFGEPLLVERDAPVSSYEPRDENRPEEGSPSSIAPIRIAVYDSLSTPPYVEDISEQTPRMLIDAVATRTYQLSHEAGGSLPYVVIREIVENLIHAHFYEVVVSIMDKGSTIRFSDQGPGIQDKTRAFEPGFSTATQAMKETIKGVGSGLPVAKECLTFSGGIITIEDNLDHGTVVTLKLEQKQIAEDETADPAGVLSDLPSLTMRQKQVLSLTMEVGSVGPTLVARELTVGLSTAYRDLASLESLGLIQADDSGKRALTSEGIRYLDVLFNR